MKMKAKDEATSFVAECELAVLATIGHEIGIDKIMEIGKACALVAVHRIMRITTKSYGQLNSEGVFELREMTVDPYLKEVKQHILDYGKNQ